MLATPIYAGANNFGIATGSNINYTNGSSRFDAPPSDTSNLTISSRPDDPSPYTFSVGDHYDVSFAKSGGSVILDNAQVIRSDLRPDGSYAVVFQGQDQNGHLTQVIWAPDYDLNTWYWDAVHNNTTPTFYSVDQSASQYSYPCYVAGTRIATPQGMRPVEELVAGDRVTTLDHGACRLLWAGARRLPAASLQRVVRFEVGVLGNDRPLSVSWQHRIFLRSAVAELLYGASEVLVPAGALVDLAGVSVVNGAGRVLVHLLCRRHEVIRAEGALSETLLLGPVGLSALDPGVLPRRGWAQLAVAGVAARAARPVLTHAEARAILTPKSAVRALI